MDRLWYGTDQMTNWLLSSYCASGSCVAVRKLTDCVEIADTKDECNQPIAVGLHDWREFIARVPAESAIDSPLSVEVNDNLVVVRGALEERLVFTEDEWVAFVHGAEAGEFSF